MAEPNTETRLVVLERDQERMGRALDKLDGLPGVVGALTDQLRALGVDLQNLESTYDTRATREAADRRAVKIAILSLVGVIAAALITAISAVLVVVLA